MTKKRQSRPGPHIVGSAPLFMREPRTIAPPPTNNGAGPTATCGYCGETYPIGLGRDHRMSHVERGEFTVELVEVQDTKGNTIWTEVYRRVD